MPLIENVPMFAVELGSHRINAKNAYLISITDPKDKKPEIAGKFAEVHYFKFHDLEKIPEDMPDAILMNDADATKIISILNKALAKNYDVVVWFNFGGDAFFQICMDNSEGDSCVLWNSNAECTFAKKVL